MSSTESQDQTYANNNPYEDDQDEEYDSMDDDALDDASDAYDDLEFNEEGASDFDNQSYSEADSMPSPASTPVHQPTQPSFPIQGASQTTTTITTNTVPQTITTTTTQPPPQAQPYTGNFFINLRHAAAEQQSYPPSAAEEWDRRFHSMRPDPPPPPPPIRIYQVQYRTTPPPNPPSHLPVPSQPLLPSPQSQSESRDPEPSETYLDSTYTTLARAKSRCDGLWKELYLGRYPGPAPEDVKQELTYAGWYEWVQVGDGEGCSVWGKQFRFVGGFRIEMWVREEVVR